MNRFLLFTLGLCGGVLLQALGLWWRCRAGISRRGFTAARGLWLAGTVVVLGVAAMDRDPTLFCGQLLGVCLIYLWLFRTHP